MSISLKPRHLKLYADLGRIFVRYGRLEDPCEELGQRKRAELRDSGLR